MVQLSVLAAIRAYEVWSGKTVPIGGQLAAGLDKFYDPRLKTPVRRDSERISYRIPASWRVTIAW